MNNTESISAACESILEAYWLYPLHPFPALYMPSGSRPGLRSACEKAIASRLNNGTCVRHAEINDEKKEEA